MQNKPETFPWFFFYKFAKYHFFIIAFAIVSTILVYQYFSIEAANKRQAQYFQEKAVKLKTLLEQKKYGKTLCNSIPYELSIVLKNRVVCGPYQNPTYFQELVAYPEQNFQDLTLSYNKINSSETIFFLHKQLGNYQLYYKIPNPIQPIYHQMDPALVMAMLVVFILIFIFTILSALRISRPIKSILEKVATIESKLPFDERLRLFYKRDEWARIKAVLNQTEQNLDQQFRLMHLESKKTATLLESIFDAIMAIDNFQNSLFYNSRFEKVFMHDQSVISQDIKLWLIFDKQQEVIDCYQKCMRTRSPQSLKAFEFHQHFYDLSVAPLEDDDGQVTGAIGVFHDVTDAKLTEQMRVDFVANVSHEIRTPLTSIKGFTQVMQSQGQELPDTMKGFLDKILFNAERLLDLFSDLLNLSVIESQNELEKKELNFTKMIDTIKESLKVTYQSKGVQIKTDLKHSTIWADRKLIEQALINLIDNACKYTFENTDIIISNFIKEDQMVISVSDSGPGISKEHLDRIFERFYRVESSRSNIKVRGTGLGLSIVKHIIRKHGGKVWAQSEENKGTVFFIELPIET